MYSTSSKIRVSVHSWPRVFKPALPIKLIAQSPTLVGLSRLLNLSGLLHHLEYLSLIIYHAFFANKNKRVGVVLYSSFPVRESLGLISYMSASQLLGLSPRTHFCYFRLIKERVTCAKKLRVLDFSKTQLINY